MYLNKRRLEYYYNTRAQANFQKRVGAEFRNDRLVNRTQMRRNYERRVSPEWGKRKITMQICYRIHQIFIT